MLQVLLEQWTSCAGVWTESEFYIQVKEKHKNRSYGSRRWMTRMEIVAKFGSTQVADQIISAKTLDAEVSQTHVRANPDLHGLDTPDSYLGNYITFWSLRYMIKILLSPSSYPQRTHTRMLDFLDLQMLAAQETRQYLIWDREGEETTVDHVTTTLFQAAEKDEDEKTRAGQGWEAAKGGSMTRNMARERNQEVRRRSVPHRRPAIQVVPAARTSQAVNQKRKRPSNNMAPQLGNPCDTSWQSNQGW